MKTTIDLPDELILEAKRTALHRRTTLRVLMLNGLRREIGLGVEGVPHGMKALVAVGRDDWKTVDADRHVETERSAWE
jgi:hypothetical protein